VNVINVLFQVGLARIANSRYQVANPRYQVFVELRKRKSKNSFANETLAKL
jgi:hypothetical protein